MELQDAVGSLCEMRSVNNDLIFVGRVQGFDGKAVTVYSSSGRQVPPVVFNTTFKMCVRLPERPMMVWCGKICGSTRGFWKLDKLARYSYAEHRSHFRQRVNAPARVMCVNSLFKRSRLKEKESDYARPCRLVDISLGGLQVRSRERFERGDWLLVTDAALLPDEPPFVFTCQVCWADRVANREFVFGCKFDRLPEQDEDRLCAGIFTLQRLELKRHRGDE